MSTIEELRVEAAATPLSEPEATRLADRFRALADPTRLRIITALDTACIPVNAVVEATGLPQPTVSHHLGVLRDSGIVQGDRRGQRVYYCLVDPAVIGIVDALHQLERA